MLTLHDDVTYIVHSFLDLLHCTGISSGIALPTGHPHFNGPTLFHWTLTIVPCEHRPDHWTIEQWTKGSLDCPMSIGPLTIAPCEHWSDH